MNNDNEETQTIEGVKLPCKKCGAFRWKYLRDVDNGDWCEAIYECARCGTRRYVELPD